MSDDDQDGGPAVTLHRLIRDRMKDHGWSYTDLERRSHNALTRGRWQQLGSGVRQRKFPDPASLTVIAQALQVDITTVVLAAAQTVGLDARRPAGDLAQLLPPGADMLSERMRDAVLTIIRAAVADLGVTRTAADPPGPAAAGLEWPKSAAPSRQRRAPTESDAQ